MVQFQKLGKGQNTLWKSMDLYREGTNVIKNSVPGRNLLCNLYLGKAAVGTTPYSWACLAQALL